MASPIPHHRRAYAPVSTNTTTSSSYEDEGVTNHHDSIDHGVNNDNGGIVVFHRHGSDAIVHETLLHHQDSVGSDSKPHDHNFPPTKSKASLFALCAALNSCNLGYDLGVSTNAGPKLQLAFQLSDDQLELFLGSLNFWSIFGALLSPTVCDRYGRRATFRTAAVAFIVGCGIMAAAPSYEILMLGRCIVGLGVGVGEAIDPMYISEIAPADQRGELVSWAEAGVAVGVVLGFSSSLLMMALQVPTDYQWRIMLALGAVMPLIMLWLVARIMPESPRWLLDKNQPDEARQVLQQIYPHYSRENIDEMVEEIQDSLTLEKEAAQAVGWTAILWKPSPAVRRMLLVGVGVAIIQQAVGIDSVMFYLLFVIKESGIQSELGEVLALILLGSVKLGFVFVGAKLFDKLGRRPLLFVSLVGCGVSLLFVSFMFEMDDSYHADNNHQNTTNDNTDNTMDDNNNNTTTTTNWSQIMVVLGLALYLAFFSSGLGPGNWVVVSEVFATSIRAKAMSVAVLPNRITATIMASTFLSMANALTWPGFFLLLAGICFASALFLCTYLPETKGRSLEEMSLYFAELTGDRSILDVEERLEQSKQQRNRRQHRSHHDEDDHYESNGYRDDEIHESNRYHDDENHQVEMVAA